ncbi:MAG: transglycosylase family protein [Thermoleophilaceae bacterium]
MQQLNEAFSRERFGRSLEQSRERREIARRKRRRLFQRRTVSIVLAGAMTVGGGAALAAGGASKIAGGSQTSSSVLRSGSSGPSVSALQQALGIAADGSFGSQTLAAVKRYQRAHGLVVDGVVGPQTAGSLGIKLAAVSAPVQNGASAGSGSGSPALQKIARCESGGNPGAVSPSGQYRGKYQFSRATWRSIGGSGDPARAPEAVQDAMAAKLLHTSGPSAWPNCA